MYAHTRVHVHEHEGGLTCLCAGGHRSGQARQWRRLQWREAAGNNAAPPAPPPAHDMRTCGHDYHINMHTCTHAHMRTCTRAHAHGYPHDAARLEEHARSATQCRACTYLWPCLCPCPCTCTSECTRVCTFTVLLHCERTSSELLSNKSWYEWNPCKRTWTCMCRASRHWCRASRHWCRG